MEVDTEYAYLSLGAINIGRIKSQGPALTAEATFANGLSHVMGSVDWDTGVVNAAFVYGPYGEIVDSVGQEQDDHLRRFNGKESDQLSKLSYYGFRYYDKQSLSWTQADPLYLFVPDIGMDEPRRMSLYSFSLNNPIRYMDPDGRDSKVDKKDKVEVGTEPGDLDPSGCTGVSGLPSDFTCQGSYTDEKGDMRIYATRNPKDLDSCAGPECSPNGTSDTVEVALLDGIDLLGISIIPAITVNVSPETAKDIEGAGILATALTGITGLIKKAAKKGLKGLKSWAKKSRKTKRKYAPRVRARGVEDPTSHNFPYSFDDDILATTPIPKKNGYNMYQKAGTMNGKEGVYEIGVQSDGVINHRFFLPNKKKKK